jgi:large subunit ribosomal protein L24
MKLKKGDNVQIMVGKDSGKQGKVSRIDARDGKIMVEGLNLFKKHQRPKKQGEKGEVVSIPRPIRVENVMLVCGSCAKPTKAGSKLENEVKSRYCKKCQATI